MTDYAHTGHARRARTAKATKLAQLAYMRDWAFIVGANAEDLRELRLEAHVPSASEETWALAHQILVRANAAGVPPTELTGSST